MSEKEIGYKKLIVWQKADKLALEVYKATKGFPEDELYGIVSQLRRAALSVPVNIVEGYARQGKKEFKQFVNIALSSLSEVKYLIDFSFRLEYLSDKQFAELRDLAEENGRVLWKFYKSL